MVEFVTGITAALGFVTLGLGLLGLNGPSVSAPGGITGQAHSTTYRRGSTI